MRNAFERKSLYSQTGLFRGAVTGRFDCTQVIRAPGGTF